MELSPHRLTAKKFTLGIRSLIGPGIFRPVRTFQCSTPGRNARRQPKSCFGENQLLPGSISLSLLTTSHRRELHNSSVRTFSTISGRFILLMASSPGFGSLAYYLRAIHTRFPCGSGLSPLACSMLKLVGSFFNRHATTVRLAPPAVTPCKHMVSDLFHRPYRAAFHLSLTVLVHYRSRRVCSLTG